MTESRPRRELHNRLARIGALLQHGVEGELDNGAVDQAFAAHIFVDLLPREILAQIDDQRRPARLENAVHFVECLERSAEVLERRAAHDEIESAAWQRQIGATALLNSQSSAPLLRV